MSSVALPTAETTDEERNLLARLFPFVGLEDDDALASNQNRIHRFDSREAGCEKKSHRRSQLEKGFIPGQGPSLHKKTPVLLTSR